MICKQCKQAFNGSTGICHLCGTVHSESPIVNPVMPEVVVIGAVYDPASPEDSTTEINKPEKKIKKRAK